MITALIIDDETNYIQDLQEALENHCPDVEVIGTALGGTQGLEMIRELDPHLIFLDIQMPDLDGFSLLKELKAAELEVEIIFTTAHDKYAIKAFRFAAVDYLMKPVNPLSLKEAIVKAEKKIASNEHDEHIAVLADNLSNQDILKNRIALPSNKGLTFVVVEDIIRCEADSNYTHFYLINGEHMIISKTIKLIAEMLLEYSFYRVHQSHLVNLNHVIEYVRIDGSYLVMEDKSKVPVPVRKRDELLKLFSYRT